MDKSLLLALLLQEEGFGRADDIPPRTAGTTALPLSFAQERLWFVDQLGVAGSTYNVPVNCVLEGDLDLGALGRAFSEVVRRHEVLRTRFEFVDGKAVQLMQDAGEFALEFADLREEPERQSVEVKEL